MHDESQRQREVDLYRIVDTLPEAAYNDIAQLASMLCDSPTALVTLVDRDRQWFKARLGFEETETGRDVAFCDHAIRQPDQLMEVPDAQLDPRFATNPLVTGEAGIRFYAGMPLVTPGGAAVGTVCVIDQKPRTLDARQRAALESLARLTINLMEGTRRQRELERAVKLDPAVAGTRQPYALAIFQVQDFARIAALQGERWLERTLQEADQMLAGILPAGDSLDRVTGSGEFIAILHGDSPEATLDRLRMQLDPFERELGARVLHGYAPANHAEESPGAVYLRADEALSAAKDGLLMRAA